MHHFIYPVKDTFITNDSSSNFNVKNFGLDEILKVGTEVKTKIYIVPSYSITYETQSIINWCVNSYNGIINTGTLSGIANSVFGTASFITGSDISNPNISSSYEGELTGFTGSLIDFNGSLNTFTGRIITASIAGNALISRSKNVISSSIIANRALLKFDIDPISKSIASGDITNPKFTLKLKVSREENLPINFNLLAAPLLEDWNMGNGYFWDGGSDDGVNWIYRDKNYGTEWTTAGGTITTPIVSQSISYNNSSDIKLDISDIVNRWIDGTVQNNGILLKLENESTPTTGSGMVLYYFSNDSNTIYRPVLDVGWDDSSYVIEELSTGSVNIIRYPPGISGVVDSTTQITGGSISGSFSGIGNITVENEISFSGTFLGSGSLTTIPASDNIMIYGSVFGLITQSILVQYTSKSCPPGTIETSSISQSLLMGILLDGPFSGSNFTASWDGYYISNGILSGSWNSSHLEGGIISSSGTMIWPSIIPARFIGPYFSGNMIGDISSTDSSSYGIFTGTLISDFTNVVSNVVLPFTGDIFLTETYMTNSVVFNSSSLEPLQLNNPFVIIIQNLKPELKANSIVRINVFGREEFPLKNFSRKTQFSQFLTPKYLPTSSFYAIKDNQTEEIIIDFDNYTKLSCDKYGNYFLLDTSGLPQERYFRILIRTEQSGSIYNIDTNNIFKIVR